LPSSGGLKISFLAFLEAQISTIGCRGIRPKRSDQGIFWVFLLDFFPLRRTQEWGAQDHGGISVSGCFLLAIEMFPFPAKGVVL